MAYDIPVRLTRLAHEAGVSHYSVLTATASNPNSWSLYVRSKGQLEATGQELFPHTSAFRAGPLDRGEDTRFMEKIACECYLVLVTPPYLERYWFIRFHFAIGMSTVLASDLLIQLLYSRD